MSKDSDNRVAVDSENSFFDFESDSGSESKHRKSEMYKLRHTNSRRAGRKNPGLSSNRSITDISVAQTFFVINKCLNFNLILV